MKMKLDPEVFAFIMLASGFGFLMYSAGIWILSLVFRC